MHQQSIRSQELHYFKYSVLLILKVITLTKANKNEKVEDESPIT